MGQKTCGLFLEKHGLLVSAKTVNGALRLVRRVVKRCSGGLKRLKAGKIKSINPKVIADAKLCIRRAFFEATGRRSAVSYFYDEAVAAFLSGENAQKMLATSALAPDELMYANGPALWVDRCDSEKIANKLTSQIKRGKKPSLAFLVKGVGLFIASRPATARMIKDVVVSSFFIRAGAFGMGGILSLNARQQNFINQWETQALHKKPADSGQVVVR